MNKRIDFITPSLIDLGKWIEDNADNYTLTQDSPQLLGFQYYAAMDPVETGPVETNSADKPTRKTRNTKAA